MSENEEELTVRMLGGFSIYYGDKPIVPQNSRNSKVLLLLEYLLCNRDRMIGQDTLIEALLGNGEYANPVAILKNLAYRLRKLLRESGVPGECILHRKNAYCFYSTIPCRLDIEEFNELTQQAAQEQEKTRALDLCVKAAEMYGGGFLPKASGEFWVMGHAVYLQNKYFDCLHDAYTIASCTDRLESVLEPLARAVTLYPYEEELCIMYIMTLYKLNRFDEAVQVYEKVTDTMLDDLGISPSERMRETYATISGGMRKTVVSPTDVREKMREEQRKAGAYYCNIEVFAELYRIMARDMERSGRSIFLMLCTIAETNGAVPANGPRMQQVAREMCKAIEAALRRGDVYTRYSPSQFVLMLMDLKQEDCRIVEERLRNHFYKAHSRNRALRLTCRTTTAADIDFMLGGSDATV